MISIPTPNKKEYPHIYTLHVIGEAEHKIIEFIRSQRTQPGYNPNTSHVVASNVSTLLQGIDYLSIANNNLFKYLS